MTETATEPMLKPELWLSFVSLLRSYAAAASLHAAKRSHVEDTGNSQSSIDSRQCAQS